MADIPSLIEPSRRDLLRILGLSLAGLGVSPWVHAQEKFLLQLDWKFNAQFAGPLLAHHEGLYQAAGIDLTIRPWESGMMVTDLVADQVDMLGCAEQNLVLSAQSEGAPIRAVATMFQHSPLSLMSLPERQIGRLSDLKGQAVGVHVDGVQAMRLVKGVQQMDELAVKRIPYEKKFDRLLNGELAAIQCYAVDEPINFFAATGIQPDVLPLSDYGYEAYAQVVFAHEKLLVDKPEAVKAILRAMFDGWDQALEAQAATARIIVDHFAEKGSQYQDIDYMTESLSQVAQFVSGAKPKSVLGSIDPERWSLMSRRFAEYGIISSAPPLEESLTPGFWPQNG